MLPTQEKVPAWKEIWPLWRSGLGTSGRYSTNTSADFVGENVPGRQRTDPRGALSFSTPCRLTAVRVPADDRSTGPPWTCSPRTFATVPPGRSAEGRGREGEHTAERQ